MDPFTLLDLPKRFDLDAQEIDARYRELSRVLHPDRFAGASASERRMSLEKAVEVNEAYRTLRDDLTRARALLAVRGWVAETETADPAFLVEMMELREALADARTSRDLEGARKLATRVAEMRDQTKAKVQRAFRGLPDAPSQRELSEIASMVSSLRYFARFFDEIAVLEEDALEGG